MAEFALPKNSKITGGKAWPKPAGATETREFRVYRWNPDDGKNPSVDTYHVDTNDCGPMVLDGLIWIKNHIDPTLTNDVAYVSDRSIGVLAGRRVASAVMHVSRIQARAERIGVRRGHLPPAACQRPDDRERAAAGSIGHEHAAHARRDAHQIPIRSFARSAR